MNVYPLGKGRACLLILLLPLSLLSGGSLSASTVASVSGKVNLQHFKHERVGEDWAPALQKALALADTVFVPAGRYPCSTVRLASGKHLFGEVKKTVFIPLGKQLFEAVGTIGPEWAIAQDIEDFSNTLVLKQAAQLQVGDRILLRGQRNAMLREGEAGVHYQSDWVLGRTRSSSCFYGEMDVVQSVVGNRIYTQNSRIFPAYYADNRREPSASLVGEGVLQRKATTLSVLHLVEDFSLSNFTIEGNAVCYMPINLQYCKGGLVENVLFTTARESFTGEGVPNLSVIRGLYVWDTKIRSVQAILSPSLLEVLEQKPKKYENYSNYNLFKIISSVNSGFEHCYANGGSHSFSITRSASSKGRGGIPSVDCYIINCLAENSIWSGVTVQQCCYRTLLEGNVVRNGAQGIVTAGRNTLIKNNRVETNYPYSSNFYYAHLKRGGTTGIALIEGYACGSKVLANEIRGFYTGIQLLDGYEDKNCFEEASVQVEGNRVYNCVQGFSIYKNKHNQSLPARPLDIQVRDNYFEWQVGLTVSIEGKPVTTSALHLPAKARGIELTNNLILNYSLGLSSSKQAQEVNWVDNVLEGVKKAQYSY